MKMFKHRFPSLLLLAGMGLAPTADANLVDVVYGVYDTDLHITWLKNANTNGKMTWAEANAWAASLTDGGFNDWRLPTTLQPDPSCANQGGGISSGLNCTGSELGNMFYGDINHGLGGTANQNIASVHNANYDLFTNIQHGTTAVSDVYWSGTPAPSADVVFDFYTSIGSQASDWVGENFYGWAVRSDVAAVPEPGVTGLLGIGALAWAGTRQKRRG